MIKTAKPIFRQVRSVTDIVKGDLLLISGQFEKGENIQLHRVRSIKHPESEWTEIILKEKGNIFFSFKMYLEGKSWAKNVQVLRAN